MKRSKFIGCILLLSIALQLFSGCLHQPTEPSASEQITSTQPMDWTLDWTMQGTWVDGAGNLGERISLSMQGQFPETAVENTRLENVTLNITWPENFPYVLANTFDQSNASCFMFSQPFYYVINSIVYEPVEDKSIVFVFAVSTQLQAAVFHCSDREDAFLVATVDPNADPLEILEHFEDFRNAFPET